MYPLEQEGGNIVSVGQMYPGTPLKTKKMTI